MEQEALLLLLLDKVRQQKQQLQEQAHIVTWAQRQIPKLWFEERDGELAHSLVIGNRYGEIWGNITSDGYCFATWVNTCGIGLEISDTSLRVYCLAYPNNVICTSVTWLGQAKFGNALMGEKLYPLEYKSYVNAMLLEAAKRLGWKVRYG